MSQVVSMVTVVMEMFFAFCRCDIWACGLAETTTEGGPGTLFTEVLFDQFMRIRHADRFWYENYEENQ